MIEYTDYSYYILRKNSKDKNGKKKYVIDEIKEAINYVKPYSSLKDKLISKKIDEKGNTIIKSGLYPQTYISSDYIDLDSELKKLSKPGFHKMFQVGTMTVPYEEKNKKIVGYETVNIIHPYNGPDREEQRPILEETVSRIKALTYIYQYGNDLYVKTKETWYRLDPIEWVVDKTKLFATTTKMISSKSLGLDYSISRKPQTNDPELDELFDEIRIYSAEVELPNFDVETEVNKLLDEYNKNIVEIKSNNKNSLSLNTTSSLTIKFIDDLKKIRDILKVKYDIYSGYDNMYKSLDLENGLINDITDEINKVLEVLKKINNPKLLEYFMTTLDDYKTKAIDNLNKVNNNENVMDYNAFKADFMNSLKTFAYKLSSCSELIEYLSVFDLNKKSNVKKYDVHKDILEINKKVSKFNIPELGELFNNFLETEKNKITDMVINYNGKDIDINEVNSLVVNDLVILLSQISVVINKNGQIKDTKGIVAANKTESVVKYDNLLKENINNMIENIKAKANDSEIEELALLNIEEKDANSTAKLNEMYSKLVILNATIDERIANEAEIEEVKLLG